LQGKANVQITKASDGTSLDSTGNGDFIARVTDSGKSSGIGVDSFSLTYTGTEIPKSIPTTLLSGGNVVIHLK
jgi:hypothetical protein